MDYFKLLNLSKEPFSNSPDPEFFYHSRQHHECLQKLELALRLRRGLNVVIGDVGTGKTTLCRQLIRRFTDSPEVETHLILDPSYTNPTEFLSAVAHSFKGYRPSINANDWQLKEVIKQYLFRNGVDENKTIVLIIDEGQKIPFFCLEILREFLNYETNDYKLLQIVIFAQKEFDKTVQAHANFADRINLYHHLNPLNFRDTRLLIKYRLEKSGNRNKIYSFFTLPALVGIFWATRGYPRKIINLCHRCILTMIIQNRSTVNFYIVRSCIPRVFPDRTQRRHTGIKLAIGFAAICLLIAFAWYLTPAGPTLVAKQPSQSNLANGPDDPTDASPSAAMLSSAEKIEAKQTGHSTDTSQTDADTARAESSPQPPAVMAGIRPEPVRLTPAASKPDPLLGQITLSRNETLSGIIQTVYGTFNSRYFRLLILANPHIEDPDRIDVGQKINLPAVPVSIGDPPAGARWWIQINQTDRIEDALPLIRNWPDSAPAIRLIPIWRSGTGHQCIVIVKQAFGNQTAARKLQRQLPAPFSSTSQMVAVQTDDIVYFADPYR